MADYYQLLSLSNLDFLIHQEKNRKKCKSTRLAGIIMMTKFDQELTRAQALARMNTVITRAQALARMNTVITRA